ATGGRGLSRRRRDRTGRVHRLRPRREAVAGSAESRQRRRPHQQLGRPARLGAARRSLRGSAPILGSDALLLRRMFGDFYSRLRLGRIAVYQTSDPARFGQVAALAVLDPVDPDRFLTDLTQYVKLGDVEQFDPKREASKAEIERLIA